MKHITFIVEDRFKNQQCNQKIGPHARIITSSILLLIIIHFMTETIKHILSEIVCIQHLNKCG